MGIAESHLLADIAAVPGLSVSEYSRFLSLELNVVARMIQRLEGRKFVIASVLKGAKLCSVTPLGARAASILTKADAELSQVFSQSLTQEEVLRLIFSLSRLAKAFMEVRPPTFIVDVPLQRELRWMLRGCGGLGRNILDSGLSGSALQVLIISQEVKVPILVGKLAEMLKVDQSSCSRLVQSLLQQKLISKRVSSRDRREVPVELSDKGVSLLDSLFARLEEKMRTLVGFSPDELQDCTSLLNRFAGPSDFVRNYSNYVLYGVEKYALESFSLPTKEIAREISLPLIWEDPLYVNEVYGSERTHKISLSLTGGVFCQVLVSEDSTSLRFTHIFGPIEIADSFWGGSILRTLTDLLSRSLPPHKKFHPFTIIEDLFESPAK